MISERQLANGFSGFWQELLPLLTPRFVRLFNQCYVEQLVDSDGRELNAIPVSVANDHPATVAEAAFFMAKLAADSAIPVAEAIGNPAFCKEAASLAIGVVDEFEGATLNSEFKLSEEELEEAIQLAKHYDFLYPHFGEAPDLRFSPSVPGAGFLPACRGDLAISETLLEIKTVNRNFSGADLRQLMIYLALDASSGVRSWSSAGFFNPRRGIVATFTVDTLLFKLSGGRTPTDVFDELVGFASTREALFDSAF